MGNTKSLTSKKSSAESSKRTSDQEILQGNLRSNIVPEFNKDISHDFQRLETLGGGKMGTVFTASKISIMKSPSERPSEGQNVYAIKEAVVSTKSKHFLECLRVEIDALKALDHPYIVKPLAVYYTKKNLYLVLQHCTGGNLYSGFPVDDSTGGKVPFSEKKTAEIIYQLLSAVAHMHAKGVCHRDLKFENILFETKHPDSKIKLIDFGIAQNMRLMLECCGTTYTMARDVLTLKGYTNKVDLWSVGVIVYMMLSLTKPFYGKNKLIITNKIKKGDFRYYSPRWESQAVSSDAKSFIEALLEKDPEKRLSAVQAMKHHWIQNELSGSSLATRPSKDTMNQIYNSIKRYSKVNILKKIALLIIAHNLSAEETAQIRNAFNIFDTQKKGFINYESFGKVMKLAKEHGEEWDVPRLFKSLNVLRDGKVTYSDFVAACLEFNGNLTEENIGLAFCRLDNDCTGGISLSNLKEILGSDYSRWNIEGKFRADFGDEISFDLFRKVCKGIPVVEGDDSSDSDDC